MELNLKLIKRITKHKLISNFDEKYDEIRNLVIEKYNYTGDIKVIRDNKWISFYIIIED